MIDLMFEIILLQTYTTYLIRNETYVINQIQLHWPMLVRVCVRVHDRPIQSARQPRVQKW